MVDASSQGNTAGTTETIEEEQEDDDIQLIQQDEDYEVMTISDSDEEHDDKEKDESNINKKISDEPEVGIQSAKDSQSTRNCDEQSHQQDVDTKIDNDKLDDKGEQEDESLNLKLDVNEKEHSTPVKVNKSVNNKMIMDKNSKDTVTNNTLEDIEMADVTHDMENVLNTDENSSHTEGITSNTGKEKS